MASIKVKFRPSHIPGREGTIYYQIIHARKVRQILTNYKVFPPEWDNKRAMVATTRKSQRNTFILSVRECIRHDLDRLTRIHLKFDASGIEYSADDVIDEFKRYVTDYSLFNFMESIIKRLRQNGRIRTSETYAATLHSFKKFRQGHDIMLDSITSDLMEAYEAWHRARGVVPNTISFYTRILRAVYNRAVEDGVIDNRYPFRKVYTGVDKTVKRALPLETIKKIKRLNLSSNPTLDYARDIFLMSFYLRGMSFIDMAFLKKSDFRNGYIIYRRRKTGQLLSIEMTKELRGVLDKYPENKTDYLFPIIRNPEADERGIYRNVSYNINRSLKKIGEMVGIPVPLTLYVARHTWASAAKAKGIPLAVITEGMGHDSETTTRIYLASLDTSAVDRANSLIISSL